MKIDVEGFEREVIGGGVSVLNRTAACMVEVHTRMSSSGTADLAEIAQLLQGCGLTFAGMATQVFSKHDRYVYGDAVFANWSRCAARSAPRT